MPTSLRTLSGLKACPLCAELPIAKFHDREWAVGCPECELFLWRANKEEVVSAWNRRAQVKATDEFIDRNLDAVLRASGSALRHYSLESTKAAMREAMRAALQAALGGEGKG